MSGGHAHDGHDDHGHGAPGAGDDVHGPAEIPPAPAVRSISPAREEYEMPWPGRLLFWPVFWVGVAFLFYGAAKKWSSPIETAGSHAGHAAAEHAR